MVVRRLPGAKLTVVSPVVFRNADTPMVVTPLGTEKLVSPVAPRNAPSPMLDTDAGSETLVTAAALSNAPLLTPVTPLGTTTLPTHPCCNDTARVPRSRSTRPPASHATPPARRRPFHVPDPKPVLPGTRYAVAFAATPVNAPAPTGSGASPAKNTLSRLNAPSNADAPTLDTAAGSTTLVTPAAFRNASASIPVTPLGTTILPTHPCCDGTVPVPRFRSTRPPPLHGTPPATTRSCHGDGSPAGGKPTLPGTRYAVAFGASPVNASTPTVAGAFPAKNTSSRPDAPANADAPILDTDAGNSMLVTLVASSNALASMPVTPLGTANLPAQPRCTKTIVPAAFSLTPPPPLHVTPSATARPFHGPAPKPVLPGARYAVAPTATPVNAPAPTVAGASPAKNTLSRLAAPSNADAPILDTDAGNQTLVTPAAFRNASSAMPVTPVGMATLPVQLVCPVATSVPRFRSTRPPPLHGTPPATTRPLHGPAPKPVLPGTRYAVAPPGNAPAPTVGAFPAKNTSPRLVAPSNADAPMLDTDAGSETLVTPVAFLNALASMPVTPLGMTTVPPQPCCNDTLPVPRLR